eukprot:GEMP01010299.1.p1 GENE.GEMP01010299.1~~GEMP01010299.1.p1  ORF type:complete len:688 (+),score=120.68 GEMP01010299.1:70-2133(+)
MWRLPAITPVANLIEDFKHRLQTAEEAAHQWLAARNDENPKRLFAKCETLTVADYDASAAAPSVRDSAIGDNVPLTEGLIQWLFHHNEADKEFANAQTAANETTSEIIRGLPDNNEPVHVKSLFPREFMKKYRLLNADDYVLKLGEGGFGSVIRCIHRGTGTHKAAKFFDGREAQGLRAWRRVEEHPNVVSLVDHFTSNVSHVEVAVMQLCHGVDVSDWLEENGDAILELDACHIFKYMVRACAHLHACGVLHRDLKLENFIFNNASLDVDTSTMNDLRLCDFGLARPMEELDEELESGVLLGTPIYMAPEVLNGDSFSAASDVYALGVCLFILLTRHFPFSNKIPRDEPNFHLLDECSEYAQDLIRGMLKENPAERLTLHDVASHPFLLSVRTREKSGPSHAMQRRDSLTEVACHSSEVQLAERTLPAGAVLFEEGDPGEDIYIVDEGDVEVWKDGVQVATLHSGDIVGEMALLYSQRRSATVKSGPEGASLLKLQGTDARHVWEKKKAIPALRSLAQIGSERDEFNESFAFFRSMYPTANPTFLVDLVQSLAPENQRRVEKDDTLIGDDEVYVSQKVFYVRTGELSVYHKGKLIYSIPPGSFIGAPCVMASLHAPRGFDCGSGADEKIRIVAHEEADVIELPLHAMERLHNKHAEDHARFLQEATKRWIVPEDSASAKGSGSLRT